jgi:hypothetical protein
MSGCFYCIPVFGLPDTEPVEEIHHVAHIIHMNKIYQAFGVCTDGRVHGRSCARWFEAGPPAERALGGRQATNHTHARTVAPVFRDDRTIVTTDNEEIATVAQKYGGEVPFTRPAELATDEAGSLGVARHALNWGRSEGHGPDVLVLL